MQLGDPMTSAGEKLDSHHYLAIVDCEHRLIAAVDAWQRAKRRST